MISRAIYDAPVQPLFNTIHATCKRAGVPVVVTNTNTALKVSAKAVVGSVTGSTAITDAMFGNAKSGLSVDGFTLSDGTYFTLLDLDATVGQVPNEFRTDAAGIQPEVLAEIMAAIGNRISEKLLSDFFTNLDNSIRALAPAANVTSSNSGKIEWDPMATPATGSKSINAVLDDMISALPLTMQVGGTAGDIVVAWVSAQDFTKLKNAVVQSYQPTKNGGFTSSYFQYVKDASTVGETRDMFRREFVRYKNVIIVPMNGMAIDTVVLTYQQGIEDARVFFDSIPAGQLNNLYLAIKGAFSRNEDLTLPVEELAGRAMFDLPFQCGELLTVNKVENSINQYKILGRLASGLVLREADKLFAALPSAAGE